MRPAWAPRRQIRLRRRMLLARLMQLADQIPQPHVVEQVSTEMSLHKLALLTREFNRAMNLPEGASLACVLCEPSPGVRENAT